MRTCSGQGEWLIGPSWHEYRSSKPERQDDELRKLVGPRRKVGLVSFLNGKVENSWSDWQSYRLVGSKQVQISPTPCDCCQSSTDNQHQSSGDSALGSLSLCHPYMATLRNKPLVYLATCHDMLVHNDADLHMCSMGIDVRGMTVQGILVSPTSSVLRR